MPSLLPRILSWGRVLARLLAGLGRGARHSRPSPLPLLSGPALLRPVNRWEALSLSPGSSSPRWSRQPAAGTAGPSGGAGLLVLKPWGLLGRQPAYCSARGTPYKSSPRHHTRTDCIVLTACVTIYYFAKETVFIQLISLPG
jgi:hypothetical protein